MGKAKLNIPMCAALVLLLLTMITTHFTAGLYARYSTTASASDSARVAKFDVECVVEKVGDDIDDTNSDPNENQFKVTVHNKSEVSIKYDLKLEVGAGQPAMKVKIGGVEKRTDSTDSVFTNTAWTLGPGEDSASDPIIMTLEPVSWTDITKTGSGPVVTKTVPFSVIAIAEQLD